MSTQVTWNIPEAENVTIVTNAATEWLAAMSAYIDANSGGAGAWWEKAGYSASTPRYLILKRKSGAAGRLIFFGETGSTAHASAIFGTTAPVGGELWVGYSASSTSNTPDQSWIATGVPLTAADFIPGISAFPRSFDPSYGPFRLNYAEHADGFVWLITNPTWGSSMTGGGGLLEDTTGTTVNVVLGAGDVAVSTEGWTGGTSYYGYITGANGGGTTTPIDTTYGGCVDRVSSVNEQIFRIFSMHSASGYKLQDSANMRDYFYQIDMMRATNTAHSWRIAGKFRQMCIGPNALRETRITTDGGDFAGYAHVHHRTSRYPALWFTADVPPAPY